MASNIDLVQYIQEQCSQAGDISVKKMFGDYAIYCNRIVVGLICDDMLFIKPTEHVRALFSDLKMKQPYSGAKEYFYIDDIDNRDFLVTITRETYKALSIKKINTNNN